MVSADRWPFGVGLLGYTLAVISDVFNSVVKLVNRRFDLPVLSEESENTVFMVFLLFLYLFGSAAIVWGSYGQDWSYFECFYFNFISYSTIGFGDYYLSGRTSESPRVVATTVVLFVGLSLVACLARPSSHTFHAFN